MAHATSTAPSASASRHLPPPTVSTSFYPEHFFILPFNLTASRAQEHVQTHPFAPTHDIREALSLRVMPCPLSTLRLPPPPNDSRTKRFILSHSLPCTLLHSAAVLQRAPAAAAITGSVPDGYGIPDGMTVRVNLTGYASHQEGDQGGAAGGARGGESSSGFFHSVTAKIRPDRTWKVLLPPRPTFGNYSVSAECSGGCR